MKRMQLKVDRMMPRGTPARGSQFGLSSVPAPARRRGTDFDPVFFDSRSGRDRRAAAWAGAVGEERRGSQPDRRRRDAMQIGDCWWLQRNYLTRELALVATGEMPQPARVPESD